MDGDGRNDKAPQTKLCQASDRSKFATEETGVQGRMQYNSSRRASVKVLVDRLGWARLVQ